MAVPKKRTPSGRRNKRRSHHGLKESNPANCPQCNEPVQPHRVCPNCGYYKGRDILKIEEKKERKEAKKKAREKKQKEN